MLNIAHSNLNSRIVFWHWISKISLFFKSIPCGSRKRKLWSWSKLWLRSCWIWLNRRFRSLWRAFLLSFSFLSREAISLVRLLPPRISYIRPRANTRRSAAWQLRLVLRFSYCVSRLGSHRFLSEVDRPGRNWSAMHKTWSLVNSCPTCVLNRWLLNFSKIHWVKRPFNSIMVIL